MVVPDPYVALGVSKDADLPAIRSAHRKLVLKSHPDRIQDPALKEKAVDTFQAIQQAYETLSDPVRRSRHDEQVKLAELKREFARRNAAEFEQTATTAYRDYLSPGYTYSSLRSLPTYGDYGQPIATRSANQTPSYQTRNPGPGPYPYSAYPSLDQVNSFTSNARDKSPIRPTSPHNVSSPGVQVPSLPQTRTSISPKELMLEQEYVPDFANSTPLFHYPSGQALGMSNQGTYSCTYHGCSQRFDTPAKLQKHKREGHRRIEGSASTRDQVRFVGPQRSRPENKGVEFESLDAKLHTGSDENHFVKSTPYSDSARYKVLPISLQGIRTDGKGFVFRSFDTIPDTGSDENAMDWATCKLLGLSLNRSRHARREFQLANGKPFNSMGQVAVSVAWGNYVDRYTDTFPVVFNVFSRLASPVILGKQFLDDTETLTKHQYRLEWREKENGRQLKIMHFNRPGSRIQCTINGLAALAHADTGAEMNLVRPSFAYKLGRTRGSLTREELYVELADGSCERISSSFESIVGVDGFYGASRTLTKFYILPGLTSEALLGENTLYEMDVFVKHPNAFVDAFDDDDEQASLNIIKWLSDRESRIVNSVGGRSTTRSNQTAMPSNLPPASLSEKAFRSALAEADARELHRREQAEIRIAGLADRQKATARDVERSRAALYDAERARLLALHQQSVNSP
jgi:hypothetical protein